MKQKEFEFSPLIVGTMRLGEWGAKMNTAQQEAFIDAMLERGLKDFDLADIYGHYTTEEDFGKVFKNRPNLRDQMRLTTKSSVRLISDRRPEHQINFYDSSKKHLIQSLEYSLRALRTDHVELFLVHRPDYLMDPHEIAEAFEQMRTQGKAKHFGVSNYTPFQFETLNELFPLVTNQIEVSITQLNAFEDGTLLQCQKHNITPTAWSALGGGSIFGKTDDFRILRIREKANELAKKYEVALDQILLAWVFRHPSGIVPVLGTSKISRVDAALGALKVNLSKQDWYVLLEASRGVGVD